MVSFDELNSKLYTRSDLFDIMMNSSGKFEQEYLNSCASTTFVIEFLTHNHNIVSYFHFTDGFSNFVSGKVSQITNEKHKNFASQKLSESKKKLKELREDFKSILDKEIDDYKSIRNIVFEWSKIVQDLSLQMDPDCIAAPAKNMIKSNYIIGGVLSLFTILAKEGESKLTKKESVPDLLMYTKGASYDDLAFLASNYLHINRDIKKIDFTNDNAWDILALKIGIPLERLDVGIVNHQMYVKAGFRGKKKVFYIADPLIVGYQELDTDEMKSYIKKNTAK